MTDYYYSDGAGAKRKKEGSFVLRIVDFVMLLLSVAALGLLLLTLITSHVAPSVSWIFAIVGLITPAIYLLAIIMALYWIIRWRWIYASLFLVPLAIGAPAVSRYYKIETSKKYGELPRRGVMRLMSYNVKYLIDQEGQYSTPAMNIFIDQVKPDVVCFQEFTPRHMSQSEEPETFSNYSSAKITGMAIYSRYKILESSENLISEDFDSGRAFWADLLVGRDTIRLYNLHLHSTAITLNDDQYLSKMEFLGDSLSDDKLKGIISRFKATSIGRAAQADSLAANIAKSPHRVIVCGDFNDTPNSYAYRRISNGLQDAFQESGLGYSHTFCGFLNLLRIDYVLVEKPLEVLSYEVVDSVKLSDHLPVVTTLKL
ncbi:MAG: endonuclease/exonuclease/phosphatase family protein [Rikenellaceae bacterium]